MKKYCTKCGREFTAVGREVICPSCKAAAQEETKRAAVLRAKRASWTGESVPVRISGRASTYVRAWAARRGLTFVEGLDSILQLTEAISCFKEMWKEEKWEAWEDITPYKSRRRDKHATENEQEAPQASKPQDAPQTTQEVKRVAKATSKTAAKKAVKTTSKTAAKKAIKTVKTAAGKKA